MREQRSIMLILRGMHLSSQRRHLMSVFPGHTVSAETATVASAIAGTMIKPHLSNHRH